MVCCELLWNVCAIFGAVSLLTYLIPLIFQLKNKEQDFKSKYGKWALVTGASSGIGLAITEKLAKQGISVVMVALDDKLLADEFQRVQKTYPSVKFVSIGANLGEDGYMSKIIEKTNELEIRMVFCNAGYLVPGFFSAPQVDPKRQLSNLECNVGSAVKISHHFIAKILTLDRVSGSNKRGMVSFTSSSAAFLPNPMSALYCSTKSFLTNFGSSIAAELRPFGIDVIVIHPSPIASRFAAGNDMLGPVKASMAIASPPSVIADDIFANAGRAIVRDKGAVTVGMKIMMKVLDFNFLTELFPYFIPLTGDFQKHKAAHGLK